MSDEERIKYTDMAAVLCSARRRYGETMVQDAGSSSWRASPPVIHKGAMVQAIDRGQMDIVRLLLEHGWTEGCDEGVVRAARSGNLEIVRLMLEFKVTDCHNETMVNALLCGHVEIFQLMIDNGADKGVGWSAENGRLITLDGKSMVAEE